MLSDQLKFALLGRYPFYYHLTMQCRITRDDSLPYIAGVVVKSGLEMKINGKRFDTFDVDDQVAILVHEFNHLARGHIQDVLKTNDMDMAKNVAMDMEINPYISEIVESKILGPRSQHEARAVFPSDIQEPAYKPWQHYYAKLKNEEEQNGEGHQNHEYFAESIDNEDIVNNVIETEMKRAKRNAGSAPKEIEDFLLEQELKRKLPWSVLLKQFLNSVVNVEKNNTWKRVNRRFPGEIPGVKSKPKAKILIGIDSSGSVSDDQLAEFYGEIEQILETGMVDIDIAVFDSEIHQEGKYTKGFEAARYCSGGTSFIPVHEKAIEGRYKGVIYLTDGYADFPDKELISYKVLWVMNTDVKPPYGTVARI